MGRLLSVVFVIGIIAFSLTVLRGEEFLWNSPVPAIFGDNNQSKVNDWFPKQNRNSPDQFPLYLSARGVLLVDYDSGDVIFAKDEKQKLPAASTIKIMTALVALENANLDSIFTVSEKASGIGENSMGLTAGEKLSLKELIYGLMLVSGNDAAVAIAEGVAGSEEEFVRLMNAKVGELGLSDTKFANATGLDDDEIAHFTTAYDMAVIARYTWEKYPQFRQIASTSHHFIDANSDHKAFDLYNDTNLLTTYPGVRGIKPGFTWEAGLCLVTYAENEGKALIGVILGSDDRRGEMKELLDYGFSKYGIFVEHPGLDL